MKSRTTRTFRKLFARLPQDIQQHAREAYRLFQSNPYHQSLQFKQVHPSEPLYSVRVGLHYRAVGTREDDVIVWYWIGSHAEFDGLRSRKSRR